MYARGQEFDRIQAVIADAGADRPLTAREILTLLDEYEENLDGNHGGNSKARTKSQPSSDDRRNTGT
ncbi:hypothetical protein ACFFQF_11390 [Haladaptatus pallidirubidus]|uniref:hypothetical protein n=1 Tax=Haladaptatus pallidirubidus TaxID=1008152 RepID=UPI0035EA3954